MALGADAIQIAMAGSTAPADYRKRVSEGQSTGMAIAGAAATGAQTAFLSIPSALVLPLIPVAARALCAWGYKQSNIVRQRATPFSHRFEASQMAMQMQQYSLGRMAEMQGLGNEAANYNGRYGRQ